MNEKKLIIQKECLTELLKHNRSSGAVSMG